MTRQTPRKRTVRDDSGAAPPAQKGKKAACHSACVACRPKKQGGLGLSFRAEPDGALVAEFFCDPTYRSYPERVHGGHLALLLDAAMGHWLFQQEFVAVTGRLNVGFAEPVRTGRMARIRVTPVARDPELYRVRAEIEQDGRVCVRGEGKFTTAGAPAGDQA